MTRHDCAGCGAPIKSWLRECEYCGREYPGHEYQLRQQGLVAQQDMNQFNLQQINAQLQAPQKLLALEMSHLGSIGGALRSLFR